MTDATEKQIAFAKKLGIEDPETFSKAGLKDMIDRAIKKRDANKTPAKTETSNLPVQVTANHTIVVNKTEKPHSYEFGKAGNRFKIYYGTIDELKTHLDLLKQENLIDSLADDLIPED